MAYTLENALDRVANNIIGDTSTEFRAYLTESVNQVLDRLWDMHDWHFKHTTATFTLTADTETVNITTAIANLRSSHDIELIYIPDESTFLLPKAYRDIIKRDPGNTDSANYPRYYSAWGEDTLYFEPVQNQNLTATALFVSKPVYPSAESDDINTDVGLPLYLNFLFEKMLLIEAWLYQDEDRYLRGEQMLVTTWKPDAIRTDMRHLESTARFKFWEEELIHQGDTFNQWLG